MSANDRLENIIFQIDTVLDNWKKTKGEHLLDEEVIARGNEIIQLERLRKRSHNEA